MAQEVSITNVPEKPYRITYDEKPTHLYARIVCDNVTPETAIAYMREIINECIELGYTHILIEREIPNMMSRSQITFTGSHFAGLDIKPMKIALVDSRLDKVQRNTFSVAATAGLGIPFKVHTTVPEGRHWLLYE